VYGVTDSAPDLGSRARRAEGVPGARHGRAGRADRSRSRPLRPAAGGGDRAPTHPGSGGGRNPLASVRVPCARMVGRGIASSLVNEVEHSTRPPRGLSSSLPAPRQRPRPLQERMAQPVWAHWVSEIHADFWSVGKLGDCGSTAWIRSAWCVLNSAGRPLAIATGHAAALSRNVANHENDQTLRLASTNATAQWRPSHGRRAILLSRPRWLKPIERRRRRSWWSTSAHSVAGSAP
jgi:hypothetical protein